MAPAGEAVPAAEVWVDVVYSDAYGALFRAVFEPPAAADDAILTWGLRRPPASGRLESPAAIAAALNLIRF